MATQGFSPRTRAEARIVRSGCDAARAAAKTRIAGIRAETSLTIRPSGSKEALLNGAPVTLEDLRARFPVLVFLPDRLAIVKGGPVVRRTYFDRMVGRLRPEVMALPSDYGNALAQRGAALRRLRDGQATAEAIEPWTEAIVRLGRALDEARTNLVSKLRPYFGEACAALGLAAAEVDYSPSEVSETMLEERLGRDIERGTTGVGPHRCDFRLTAAAGDLRAFGSQGQQRAAVLGLLLAEAACLSAMGRPPALLLDDVLSELDRDRRIGLLTLLEAQKQTLVTSTETEPLLEPTCVVRVSEDSVTVSVG